MKKNVLSNELRELTIEFLKLEDKEKNIEEKNLLFYVINNSITAMRYISLIEDEYEIEFEDEDINLSFFSGFDHIAQLIEQKNRNA